MEIRAVDNNFPQVILTSIQGPLMLICGGCQQTTGLFLYHRDANKSPLLLWHNICRMHRTIDMTLSLLFLLRHLHASSYPAIYPTSPSDSSVPCLGATGLSACRSRMRWVAGHRRQSDTARAKCKSTQSRTRAARVLSLYPQSSSCLPSRPPTAADRWSPHVPL